MSSILDWFKDDFGRNNTEQLKTIWEYLPKDAQKEIAKGGYKFGYQDYSWDLNAQPEKKVMKAGSGAKAGSGNKAGSTKKAAAGGSGSK